MKRRILNLTKFVFGALMSLRSRQIFRLMIFSFDIALRFFLTAEKTPMAVMAVMAVTKVASVRTVSAVGTVGTMSAVTTVMAVRTGMTVRTVRTVMSVHLSYL